MNTTKKNKNLFFKKTISTGLVCALVLNISCGVQTRDKSIRSVSSSMKYYLNEEGSPTHADVNVIEPILIEDSLDENGDRELTFDVPEIDDTSADPKPGIPGLDTNPPHSIRVGRDGIDSSAEQPLKTEEDVLRALERIEQELLVER